MDIIEDVEALKGVFNDWLRQDRSPAVMVLRTNHALYGDTLLALLADHYRGTPDWPAFLDAVMTLPPSWFDNDGPISPTHVGRIFGRAEDLRQIVERHGQVVRNRDHPLPASFRWDAYWTQSVQWFIQRGELRRAFDELKRAGHGLYVGDRPDRECRGSHDSVCDVLTDCHHRVHAASPATVGQLVPQLYHAMVEQGLLTPITDDDLTIMPVRTPLDSAKAQQRRSPHARRVKKPHRPGYEFACQFRRRASGFDQQGRVTPDVFYPAGVMILRMAEHFARQRNARRRQKLIAVQPA